MSVRTPTAAATTTDALALTLTLTLTLPLTLPLTLALGLALTRFARSPGMGAFAYSEEEGTPAAEYEEQLDQELREYRRDELISLQQGIGESWARSMYGKEIDVLVDGVTEDGELFGRTQWDAPDIDNIVFLSESEDTTVPRLEVGQMRRCRVTGRSVFDLEAAPIC